MPNTAAEQAIVVQNITKVFRMDVNLRASFAETVKKGVVGFFSGNGKDKMPDKLALDDVSFTVAKGSTTGIIGRNGSGKSTLLRLLSGITEPTSGSIQTHGRVTSILDVGSGFHMDLSGRENVLLSGSLMGMDEQLIKERLPEIIEFSEIGEYIDVPVKYYSSGMYLRLAFSLAINLDFEILLIDEVIEVGDESFKIKSYNKLKQLTGSGRTIMICTHNMRSVADLCTDCIVMEKGKIVAQGDPQEMVQTYLEEIWSRSYELDSEHIPLSYDWTQDDKIGNEWVKPLSFQFEQDITNDQLLTSKPIRIHIKYQKLRPDACIDLGVWIYDHMHKPVLATNCMPFEPKTEPDSTGTYEATLDLPGYFFSKGLFFLRLHFLKDNRTLIYEYPADLPFKMHMPTTDPNNLKIDGKTGSPLYMELPWSKQLVGEK